MNTEHCERCSNVSILVSVVQMLLELEWFQTVVSQCFHVQHTLTGYILHLSGGKQRHIWCRLPCIFAY